MTLPETLSRLLPFDGFVADVVGAFVGATAVAVLLLAMAAVAGPWAKRRIAAAFWGKIGPNRMGPLGLLVIPADVLRLLSKELVVPDGVDRPAWDVAPLLVPFSAMLGFAVLPLGSGLQLADPETGVAFAFAAASIATLGLLVGGYASNNKYSLVGELRAVAQNVAYEIPLVVTAASVVLLAGTMRTSGVVAAQSGALVTVGGVGIRGWFAFVNPFGFAVFLVANLAEVGRNPFDTPEAPTEIVAGHMTEYSSVYFVLLYLGEFLHIFLGGGLVATLFLGGPTGPLVGVSVLPGVVWFLLKVVAVFLLTQWARSAVPRVRIDQLIEIGWKGMLVLAFGNLVVTAVLVGALETLG